MKFVLNSIMRREIMTKDNNEPKTPETDENKYIPTHNYRFA